MASHPDLKAITLSVSGAVLDGVDGGGTGQPVLFLHGALTDLRMWLPHLALAAGRCRPIAYTQRYHGTRAWPAEAPPYGTVTQARDLIDVIDQLQCGPVAVVAWSSACHAVLDAALTRPGQFHRLFLFEPGVPTYVTDEAAQARIQADGQAGFGPVFEAAAAGDLEAALKRLIAASGGSADYFDRQTPGQQAIQRENLRTLPQLLFHQQPPRPIDAKELAALQVPTCVGYGSRSRPMYAEVAAAAQACLPDSEHLVVPEAGHMWPQEDPAAFVAAALAFVLQGR